MTIIAETESDLPPEMVEKLRAEIAAFHKSGEKVIVRTNVPGTGFPKWDNSYKLPTLRYAESE